ncbi:hydroxymethylglutaryl-CoA lyase [Rhodospirillaceae bacterium SYSU D60014]|uniref:hydroxymethylglutaryl-CoA lyase n=1 Tax=Virgifigura deserti TaxID=2268457 RepID=UPI000E673025
MTDRRRVEFVEVAPRDGFQSIGEPIPTAEKIAIIDGLLEAGFRRMEIGSFVNPKAVPQMADMAEVAVAFRDRKDARLSILVPNSKGAEIALESGYRALVFVVSVSETHNRKNVRRSVAESLDQLRSIVETIGRSGDYALRIDLATAFDCPFDGTVSLDDLRRVYLAARSIAPDAEFALCDTTGCADPLSVETRFSALIKEDPQATWAFHGHDTFGMGVANSFAAYSAGVRIIDAATAGLGGCPFAPGASGNTAMEDLVFAFTRGGVDSGIDLERLLNAADRIARLPGGQTESHLRQVPRERIAQVLPERTAEQRAQ